MRVRRLLPGLVAVLALAALVVLCVRRGPQVSAALHDVSWRVLALMVAIHVVTLVVRTEAWLISLRAIDGERLSREIVHGANAAAFIAGALQAQAAMPTRLTVLRRLAGERAPRPLQVALSETPIFVLEVACASLVLVGAVLWTVARGGGAGVAWWVVPLAVTITIGLPLGARFALVRFGHRPTARGLAVLERPGARGRLAVTIVVVCGLGLVRAFIALDAVGLAHGPVDVALAFGALGALGLLPLGPSAAPAATLATAGGGGDVGTALAAGLALGASSLLGVAGYVCGVAVLGSAARGARRRDAAEVRRQPV